MKLNKNEALKTIVTYVPGTTEVKERQLYNNNGVLCIGRTDGTIEKVRDNTLQQMFAQQNGKQQMPAGNAQNNTGKKSLLNSLGKLVAIRFASKGSVLRSKTHFALQFEKGVLVTTDKDFVKQQAKRWLQSMISVDDMTQVEAATRIFEKLDGLQIENGRILAKDGVKRYDTNDFKGAALTQNYLSWLKVDGVRGGIIGSAFGDEDPILAAEATSGDTGSDSNGVKSNGTSTGNRVVGATT